MAGFNKVNDLNVKEVVSDTILQALVQGILHKNKFGVLDSFISNDSMKSSSVCVYMPEAETGELRMLGGTDNGDWINDDNIISATNKGNFPRSSMFVIDLLKLYDKNKIITKAMLEMVAGMMNNYDLNLQEICKTGIANKIATEANAQTFAIQIAQFLYDSFSPTPTTTELNDAVELYTYDSTNRHKAMRSFLISNTRISMGCKSLHVAYFPANERQAFVFNPSFGVDLREGMYNLASDTAAFMLAQGGYNPFSGQASTIVDYQTGFWGQIDGVPLYAVGGDVIQRTYYYLGLDTQDDAEIIKLLNQLCCLISPARATIRGLRAAEFNVTQSEVANGIVIQPYFRFGVRCLSGKALKCIFSGDDFKDETTALASITKIRNAINVKLPNLSYDNVPLIVANNYLQTYATGKQDAPVEGLVTASSKSSSASTTSLKASK